jgi:hypothetical protein
MQRLRFEAFMESLDDDEKEGIELAVFNMMDSFPDDEFLDYLERPEIEATVKVTRCSFKSHQRSPKHLHSGPCTLE